MFQLNSSEQLEKSQPPSVTQTHPAFIKHHEQGLVGVV